MSIGVPYGASPPAQIEDTVLVPGTPGENAVQTIGLVSAGGGTFTLTFQGETTTPIPYNASAAAVQTALQNLDTIRAGNALVTGDSGGPYTVEFLNALANQSLPLITADWTNLTA